MPEPESSRKWCIYYDNGSTFDNQDGEWNDAPVDGVICIVRKDGDRTEFHSGGDFYIRYEEDGSIADTSDIGPTLRALKFIKFGRYTSNKNQERIMTRARMEWVGK